MDNIFDFEISNQTIGRINKLSPDTKALWGKMNVSQMLAHCNVTYELVYEEKHPKPSNFKKVFLKLLVKSSVVNEKSYRKNSPTAPEFRIKESKDFGKEKKRLIDYIKKTQNLGNNYFNNKESHSFSKLSDKEWNNMFYKHLNHHLTQFGV